MTDSTGTARAAGRPASGPRIIPAGLRRLVAGAWLAALLAATAAAGTASASSGAAPYAITEIGPAPATGFKISDIGAVPTPTATPPTQTTHR